MRHRSRFRRQILFVALLAPVWSQQVNSWRDTSPHSVQFVSVDDGVRLEVLDWGGSGKALVLLAGGGNTAHVFDEFAPKLAADCHVYGITRRGFGASGYSASADESDRLRDDVLAVLDALKLNRPVLAGHSIAGSELTSVANLHPDRIGGLVYLEAGYPYAFDNGEGPEMKEFQIRGPQPPNPADSDLASFSALQKWDTQTYGFRIPEAELRQTWDSTSDGRPRKPRDFSGSQALMKVLTGTNKYRNIPVPALVIFASPHLHDTWIEKSTDAAVRQKAETYFTTIDSLTEKQAKVLEDSVHTARVMRLPGRHYIFLSNESDMLREMRAFLASVK